MNKQKRLLVINGEKFIVPCCGDAESWPDGCPFNYDMLCCRHPNNNDGHAGCYDDGEFPIHCPLPIYKENK